MCVCVPFLGCSALSIEFVCLNPQPPVSSCNPLLLSSLALQSTPPPPGGDAPLAYPSDPLSSFTPDYAMAAATAGSPLSPNVRPLGDRGGIGSSRSNGFAMDSAIGGGHLGGRGGGGGGGSVGGGGGGGGGLGGGGSFGSLSLDTSDGLTIDAPPTDGVHPALVAVRVPPTATAVGNTTTGGSSAGAYGAPSESHGAWGSARDDRQQQRTPVSPPSVGTPRQQPSFTGATNRPTGNGRAKGGNNSNKSNGSGKGGKGGKGRNKGKNKGGGGGGGGGGPVREGGRRVC